MNVIYLGILWYLVFIVSTSCHEGAHALVAYWGGDRTAYEGGQATIDPWPHIRREPMGMVFMPLVSIALMGMPLGFAHVPYNPLWATRYPKRAALMSIAGPSANFALAAIAFIGLYIGLNQGVFTFPSKFEYTHIVDGVSTASMSLGLVLSMFFSQNIILALFNLMPLPPLDGSGAMPFVLGRDLGAKYQEFFEQPMMGFIGLIVAWNLFPLLFGKVFPLIIRALYQV